MPVGAFLNFLGVRLTHIVTRSAPGLEESLSAGKHKQEFPPLLAQGFHTMTVEALRELCVSNFIESKVRGDIMAGFEAIYERAIAVGVEGEFWVDGSFLTKKIDPEDIDFVLLTPAHFRDAGTPAQQEFIEWLISNENDPKKSFLCHTDAVLLFPPDSPWYESSTVAIKKHWEEKVYGFSVTTREPKGIVIIKIEVPEPEDWVDELFNRAREEEEPA